MSRTLRLTFLLLIVAVLLVQVSAAQVTTGTPPFGSFSGGPDVINIANLNDHWTIPVFHKPGRGTDFNYNLSYDSSVWFPVSSNGTQTWQPVANWGWTSSTAAVAGHLSFSGHVVKTCPTIVNPKLPPINEETDTIYSNWIFYDYLGSPHPFSGGTMTTTSSPCGPASSTSLTATATDGSGYVLQATAGGGAIYNSKGTLLTPPLNQFVGTGTLTDRNGNIISVDSSGNITDTLGNIALSVSGTGTPSSPIAFTYTAPSGAAASYTMKFASYTVQTKFGCNGIADYGPTSNNLVSEIDLPDGSKYSFAYEPTPGVSGNVTGRVPQTQSVKKNLGRRVARK